MKYKLIHKATGEEHLCDKVTIDNFDYYITDKKIHFGYVWNTILEQIETMFKEKTFHDDLKGVICTNNPNIDIPQILEELNETLIHQIAADLGYRMLPDDLKEGIKAGYRESKETHPFSGEDMIEFERFCREVDYKNGYGKEDRKELLQYWKEQQPKIVYYND